MRKEMLRLTIAIVFVLSTIAIVPHNASATLPTITNYGCIPSFGDVGMVFHFWMKYTDADNDAPLAGYPRGIKGPVTTYTWPAFTFIKNDSGDSNYVDGCLYYYNYYYMPIIGVTIWNFEVKSGADAVVRKLIAATTNQVPASILKFQVFPQDRAPNEYVFVATYISPFNYPPVIMNCTVDGINHTMTKNDTGDTDYTNGAQYYYKENLTSGLHTFQFWWKQQNIFYPLINTYEQFISIEDTVDYNRFYVTILFIAIICVFGVIIFYSKK